jgi:hypothetical protein
MKKHSLNSPYVIMPFKHHEELKGALLDLIEKARYNSPEDHDSETLISKADWFDAKNMSRDWVNFLASPLLQELQVLYKEIGFDTLRVHEIWFQQYLSGSEHGWHSHSGNFTNVYYLEFPENSPKTTLLDPFDRSTIIEVDVKEGDLLAFPSYVLHKAPKVDAVNRKTIISYNIDCDISNDFYKTIGK